MRLINLPVLPVRCSVLTHSRCCDDANVGCDCMQKVYNRTSPDANQWRRFVLRHRAQVMEV